MSAISDVAGMVEAQVVTPESHNFQADPTPAPTPGPFMQLIEEIIKAILPMLAACIPAIASQTKILNRPRLLHREQLAATINLKSPPDAPKVAILHAMLSVGSKLDQTHVTAMQAEVSAT
jgi:hypothetical protein